MKSPFFWLVALTALLALASAWRQTDTDHEAAARIAPAVRDTAASRRAARGPTEANASETLLAICEQDFTGKRSPFWKASGAGHVALTLPGGREVEAVIERTEWRGVDRFVSCGRIRGHERSVALFAYARGEVSGYLNVPALGEFQLSGSGNAGAATIAATGGLSCAGGIEVPPRARAAPALDHAVTNGAAGTIAAADAAAQTVTIDVLGLYLRDSFGPSTTEAVALSNFDLNIELSNRCYSNSQIPLRLRLVRVAQTNYSETNTTDPVRLLGDALTALRSRDDGWMDEIHALRDEAGADLVFLASSRFAPGAGGPSGMSYILYHPSVRSPRDWMTNADFGFCVVKARADNNFSALPHELGHNFGCAHDRPNAGTTGGAFPYSFGYKFTAGNGLRYRTIMAIGSETSALLFSNPRLESSAFGVPVGVAESQPGEADNAQTIARAMFEIAAFRLNADVAANHRLINVATRAWVGADAESLIGGFIVEGSESAPVVVRALGPSLDAFGVDGAMTDPAIELRRQSDGALVRRNDNWREGDAIGALVASGLAPPAALEPALHVLLPPGGYSAVVSAADGRTGNGLVEVFSVGGGDGGGRLRNLSTRALAGRDGREMIGGFVVHCAPGKTKRIVIRALGPSLRDLGVNAVLEDPLIELHDSGGALLLVQDDFGADLPAGGGLVRRTYAQANVFAAGLQPGNPREPCVMLDLAAGAYSVVVRPAEGTGSGVALLEVFEIPPTS
jgi:hypothetical protein